MEVACADADTRQVTTNVPARAVATLSRFIIGCAPKRCWGARPPNLVPDAYLPCAGLPEPCMNERKKGLPPQGLGMNARGALLTAARAQKTSASQRKADMPDVREDVGE